MWEDNNFHIQWHITDFCNLRCRHCYQDSYSPDRDLGKAELFKIADNIIETMKLWRKKLTVSLTGGEPFLKKELWDLLVYLSSSKVVSKISIITNGTLVDKYRKQLKSFPKLKEILVSLDGVTPEVNDDVRGKGIFEKVTDNLLILKREGFRVLVMYTVLKRNLNQAQRLLSFAKEYSLDGFILERFIPLGQSKGIKEELVSPEELRMLYSAIFQQAGIGFFQEAVQYHALKVELSGDDTDLFGAECVAGRYGCAILPSGEVLPCRRFYLPIGNLLKDSLNDIWNNSNVLNELRKGKKNLKGKCSICRLKECAGCRALAYAVSRDYLAEDPLCWLERK